MIRLVKRITLSIPGLPFLIRYMTRQHLRSLLYHRFCSEEDASTSMISASLFTKQIEYIGKHFHPVFADQYFEKRQSIPSRKRPLVIVTVDDGYRDVLDVAAPIAEQFKVPMTVFLTTRFVDGEIWLWWDKVKYLINTSTSAPSRCSLPNIQNPKVNDEILLEGDREKMWHQISDHLVQLRYDIIEKSLSDLAGSFDVYVPDRPVAPFEAITWDRARDFEGQNIKFGAHTSNHWILTNLPPEIAESEIKDSLVKVFGELKSPSRAFAYPQGRKQDYTESLGLMAIKHGAIGCFSAHKNLSPKGVWDVPRYSVSTDMIDFYWKLNGFDFIVEKFKQFLSITSKETAQ